MALGALQCQMGMKELYHGTRIGLSQSSDLRLQGPHLASESAVWNLFDVQREAEAIRVAQNSVQRLGLDRRRARDRETEQ